SANRGAVGLALTNQDGDEPVTYSAFLSSMAPRGPGAFEQWSMQLIQKDAPPALRESVRQITSFSAIVADDFEAWQSMGRAVKGAQVRKQTIKYNALLGSSTPPEWEGPALVHKGFGKDDLQWHFWLRWYDLMTQPLN